MRASKIARRDIYAEDIGLAVYDRYEDAGLELSLHRSRKMPHSGLHLFGAVIREGDLSDRTIFDCTSTS